MGYVKVYDTDPSEDIPGMDSECYIGYNSNYGTNAMRFTFGSLNFYFSYRSLVALVDRSTGERLVRENNWGPTTGKHLRKFRWGSSDLSTRDLSTSDFLARAYNMLTRYFPKKMVVGILGLKIKGRYPNKLVALETGEIINAKNVEGDKAPNTKGRVQARRNAAYREREAAAKRRIAARKAAATRRYNREIEEEEAAKAVAFESLVSRMQEDVFLQVVDIPESML